MITLFTRDIHNEYVRSDGSLIWGFTDLDMAADMHGLDDMIVATCADCGSQVFTSLDDDVVWLHVTDMGCNSQDVE